MVKPTEYSLYDAVLTGNDFTGAGVMSIQSSSSLWYIPFMTLHVMNEYAVMVEFLLWWRCDKDPNARDDGGRSNEPGGMEVVILKKQQHKTDLGHY